MLSGHGGTLDRRLRFSLDDEAIETLCDQYCDRFGNRSDNASLGFIRHVKNRQYPVLEDWIWIQNQDAGFHKKDRGNCSLESRNPALAVVVNVPKPASAAGQETRPALPHAQCGNELFRVGKAFAAHAFRRSWPRCF